MIEDLKKDNIFYKNYEIINFINTNDIEKKLILEWRNNDDVRKWMINKDLITIEEHFNYIESLKNNKKKLCFLLKEKNDYLGIVEFDEINNNSASFGINKNIMSTKKGLGELLEKLSIYIAKTKLNINKLTLSVLKDNIRAIELYNKSNYSIKYEKEIYNNILIYMEKKL